MMEVTKSLAADGANITLANVVEDVPSYVMVQLPEGVIDEAKTNARKELEAIAAAAGVKADIEIGRGRAHSAILACADRIGADLIVIASHDPGLQDYLLGTTAARVVRHAKCAVLVTR
jgi:nucleotide-binding universal stress UspA family protein